MLALVVDDSRMARYVLGKMLQEQGIDVDAVESAEEALGYLCGKHPDMIFMDHTMPGMNGIQALRAIKNDPKTTAIPIMMYTSKEGEVYMSQARKAGAAEVLPKQLKPEQLTEVLQRQQLLPEAGQRSVAANDEGDETLRFDDIITANDTGEDIIQVARAAEESVSNRQFTQQVRHLLQQHKDELAEQSHARTEHLIGALEERLERLAQGLDAATQQFTAEHRLQHGNKPRWIALLTTLTAAVVLIWLMVSNTRLTQQLGDTRQALNEQQQQQSTLTTQAKASASQLEETLKANQASSAQLIQGLQNALEWSLNETSQIPWGQVPFNDALAERLGSLLPYLATAGFTGTLTLTSHLGQFCTVAQESGTAALPATDSSATLCHVDTPRDHEAIHQGTSKTPGFEEFLNDVDYRYGDQFRIELRTAGTRLPIQPYPDLTSEMSAGEWNAVAARNHRVDWQIQANQP